MKVIEPEKVKKLLERENKIFTGKRPVSRALFEKAKGSLLGGVPMNWMTRWPGSFPVFVKEAKGAQITDVDGHTYLDLCLGDTGSMVGHSPDPVVKAVSEQMGKGITTMLPSEDSIWVGRELQERFGLPFWQVAATATDANRFTLRLAREITGRQYVLVFNGCYHGSVDEALASLENGKIRPRRGNIGPPVDPSSTTKVIEFNDLEALEVALSTRDVACVLCEPAMTNIGIIHPIPGYHEALRDLTRRFDTLLIIDETHTICCGPGGYTAAHNLEPDIVTLGKTVAGGIPAAVYGFSEELGRNILNRTEAETSDTSGVGGTLSGNILQMAAIRATLEHMLTAEAFEKMISLARLLAKGVDDEIKERGLPWHVTRLGCRTEYRFRSLPPQNGGEAEEAGDPELDKLMHLFALNRGILLTPFHNMALISPCTGEADVDRHSEMFKDCVRLLLD